MREQSTNNSSFDPDKFKFGFSEGIEAALQKQDDLINKLKELQWSGFSEDLQSRIYAITKFPIPRWNIHARYKIAIELTKLLRLICDETIRLDRGSNLGQLVDTLLDREVAFSESYTNIIKNEVENHLSEDNPFYYIFRSKEQLVRGKPLKYYINNFFSNFNIREEKRKNLNQNFAPNSNESLNKINELVKNFESTISDHEAGNIKKEIHHLEKFYNLIAKFNSRSEIKQLKSEINKIFFKLNQMAKEYNESSGEYGEINNKNVLKNKEKIEKELEKINGLFFYFFKSVKNNMNPNGLANIFNIFEDDSEVYKEKDFEKIFSTLNEGESFFDACFVDIQVNDLEKAVNYFYNYFNQVYFDKLNANKYKKFDNFRDNLIKHADDMNSYIIHKRDELLTGEIDQEKLNKFILESSSEDVLSCSIGDFLKKGQEEIKYNFIKISEDVLSVTAMSKLGEIQSAHDKLRRYAKEYNALGGKIKKSNENRKNFDSEITKAREHILNIHNIENEIEKINSVLEANFKEEKEVDESLKTRIELLNTKIEEFIGKEKVNGIIKQRIVKLVEKKNALNSKVDLIDKVCKIKYAELEFATLLFKMHENLSYDEQISESLNSNINNLNEKFKGIKENKNGYTDLTDRVDNLLERQKDIESYKRAIERNIILKGLIDIIENIDDKAIGLDSTNTVGIFDEFLSSGLGKIKNEHKKNIIQLKEKIKTDISMSNDDFNKKLNQVIDPIREALKNFSGERGKIYFSRQSLNNYSSAYFSRLINYIDSIAVFLTSGKWVDPESKKDNTETVIFQSEELCNSLKGNSLFSQKNDSGKHQEEKFLPSDLYLRV